MQAFWDDRARENALYFVDTKLCYGSADEPWFWTEGEHELERVLGRLGVEVTSEDVVLDLGCGVGRLTRPLAGRAAQVLALDVSNEMLARAQHYNGHLSNVRWIKGDGVSLAPVGDRSVDACVSHVVFQHIPDPRVTLGYVREMARVLRPGGWAAFQVSNDPALHRFRPELKRLRWRLRVLARRAPRAQNDPRWRGSAVDLDDLRATAADAGLTLKRVENPGHQYCLVLANRQPP